MPCAMRNVMQGALLAMAAAQPWPRPLRTDPLDAVGEEAIGFDHLIPALAPPTGPTGGHNLSQRV